MIDDRIAELNDLKERIATAEADLVSLDECVDDLNTQLDDALESVKQQEWLIDELNFQIEQIELELDSSDHDEY